MTEKKIQELEIHKEYSDKRFDNFQQEYRRDAGRQRKRLCEIEKRVNDIYTAVRVFVWMGKLAAGIGIFFGVVYAALKTGDLHVIRSWWEK